MQSSFNEFYGSDQLADFWQEIRSGSFVSILTAFNSLEVDDREAILSTFEFPARDVVFAGVVNLSMIDTFRQSIKRDTAAFELRNALGLDRCNDYLAAIVYPPPTGFVRKPTAADAGSYRFFVPYQDQDFGSTLNLLSRKQGEWKGKSDESFLEVVHPHDVFRSMAVALDFHVMHVCGYCDALPDWCEDLTVPLPQFDESDQND